MAGLLLAAGLAQPASAATRPFSLTVSGGSLQIGNQFIPISSVPECSNGQDDEYDSPFTPSTDGLVDFPADPQCSSAQDNDEGTAGFQALVPITLNGTINETTGAFTIPVSGFNFPDATLTVTSPVTAFIHNATTADAPITGTIDPHTGQADFTNFDLSFAIDICSPDIGPTPRCSNPPAPYGTGSAWTASCLVNVDPPALSSTDSAGSPYQPGFGVTTVANSEFHIDAPTNGPTPGDINCGAGLGGQFGLPSDTSSIGLTLLDTGAAINPPGYIAIGNATTFESIAPNKTKLTFPVTIYPAPTTDVSFTYEARGLTAEEANKPVQSTADFLAVNAKTKTIKAGKTTTSLSVTVLGDALVEPVEYLTMNITSPPAGYTVAHQTLFGDALGSIKNRQATDDIVSVTGGSVYEGSHALVNGKPVGTKATFQVVLSNPESSDVVVSYCTHDGTAEANTGTGKTTVYKDYVSSPCTGTKVKTKTIKAGKVSTAIAVNVNQDSVSESNESFSVELLSVVSGPASLGTDTASMQIRNDD
jgi:hypothetical protein